MHGDGALQVVRRLAGPAQRRRQHAQMMRDRAVEGDRGAGHHAVAGEGQQRLVQLPGGRACAEPGHQLGGERGAEQELVVARYQVRAHIEHRPGHLGGLGAVAGGEQRQRAQPPRLG